MKNKFIFILLIVHIISVNIVAENYDNIKNDNLIDSVLLWLTDTYDSNAEYSEIRNESIFILLKSDKCENFIRKVSQQDDLIINKFYKELSTPVNDSMDIKKCLYQIKRSKIPIVKKCKIKKILKKHIKTTSKNL